MLQDQSMLVRVQRVGYMGVGVCVEGNEGVGVSYAKALKFLRVCYLLCLYTKYVTEDIKHGSASILEHVKHSTTRGHYICISVPVYIYLLIYNLLHLSRSLCLHLSMCSCGQKCMDTHHEHESDGSFGLLMISHIFNRRKIQDPEV